MRKLWLLKDEIDIEEFHSYRLPSMRQFLEAVRARNPQAAAQAMNNHVRPLMALIRKAHETQAVATPEGAE